MAISELQIRLGIPGEVLTLTFSDTPWCDHQLALRWAGLYQEDSGNIYEADDLNMKLTISSLLGSYFPHPPKKLFVAIDVCDAIRMTRDGPKNDEGGGGGKN